MSLLRIPLLAACAFALAASHAAAATIFTATITTDQEPGPINPTLTTGAPRPIAFGTATFTLNDAQTALAFTATIFNIDVTGAQTADTNDNLSAAHIHGGANFPPANNPVVWGFFGAPFNNNNPSDGTLTPFANGVGGTFTGTWDLAEGQNTTLGAQLPNLFAGRTYINFHTVQFGGGEIRGAILNNVPDGGASAALLGFACAGLLALRRKIARR